MSDEQQHPEQAVVHLAEHMARLKEAATHFHQSTTARERGHFSPSEDDQVVHLWVSYHMARNALFELITKYQQDSASETKANLTDFAVTYAAATVLVDAGRFLRELFADEPVIRRKLNESYELYGIPADSFDAIQMSLSDPGHVLELYWANQVFDEHESRSDGMYGGRLSQLRGYRRGTVRAHSPSCPQEFVGRRSIEPRPSATVLSARRPTYQRTRRIRSGARFSTSMSRWRMVGVTRSAPRRG